MDDIIVSYGNLFMSDFLADSIRQTPEWHALDDHRIDQFIEKSKDIFANFPANKSPNESQTEADLIKPMLHTLGWKETLDQQNLSSRGRFDIPDLLLFENAHEKDQANAQNEEWKRYNFAKATLEAKRWGRPLDRGITQTDEKIAPSTQMLRYLRKADDMTNGQLRWGILTNGAKWRLYYAGARSIAEHFFELDLAALLDLPEYSGNTLVLDKQQRRHWLTVFVLIFRREAFLPSDGHPDSFHKRVIEHGKLYEERITRDLSEKVFNDVFPSVINAIVEEDSKASLSNVREAALVLLYRLLFVLYAEDRDLLPTKDRRYDTYALRKIRLDIKKQKERGKTFSNRLPRYWEILKGLFTAIDEGDDSIGLPPYNGGLFNQEQHKILSTIDIPDNVMGKIIDDLSFDLREDGRKYINYRNLSVQHLGSIYERFLEYEAVYDNGTLTIRPNAFARKGSGSYYTPDELVRLILKETLEPLIQHKSKIFEDKIKTLQGTKIENSEKIKKLHLVDTASSLLELKICDPAMGSGHFLVALVDYLAAQIIEAMAEAEKLVPKKWGNYTSPLSNEIDKLRNKVIENAEKNNWSFDTAGLDDKHIIHRMVLKRCIYGVDKNPMAVELAKVALWLHTFTVGAPLSFLDHHLRCGDSLFGCWVHKGIRKAETYGTPLLLHEPMHTALGAATGMQEIERLADIVIHETTLSANTYTKVTQATMPLNAILGLIHAFEWMQIKDKEQRDLISHFFDGSFGDPIAIAQGTADPHFKRKKDVIFQDILKEAQALAKNEHFMNWQVSFPNVWSNWEFAQLEGGFDAVVGNPPWDRMKLQQVEWFAERRLDIAKAQRAAEREAIIAQLKKDNDPLATDFTQAETRAQMAMQTARSNGNYPMLSKGDINLYSLFVERAMQLVKKDGFIGLLVPTGIASDKTASTFFKDVATQGKLKALYDFENKKVFFPDVDSRFKFCVFVASKLPSKQTTQCAFFLHNVDELEDENRCFEMSAKDFALVNPNTGTAPIFRTRRDAKLTRRIYANTPILVDRSQGKAIKTWPVKYSTMFHMTNDSGLFRTKTELEEQEEAWPIGGGRYDSTQGEWLPLYEGKMVQAYDHRAASITVNLENQHRPAQPQPTKIEQHQNPNWIPNSQFWVCKHKLVKHKFNWWISYKMITAPTNARSIIATFLPLSGVGNSMGILLLDKKYNSTHACSILGCLNSIVFDFVIRQKIQGQNINWYIVEQLPVIPLDRFNDTSFGEKSAAEIIKECVLELTYTAHDMADFAHDMSYVDKAGKVLPPFIWEDNRRLHLRAKLDALFFILYNITNRDDIRYIYATFPIVEREEITRYSRYLSCDLCLAYLSALKAGKPDANIQI